MQKAAGTLGFSLSTITRTVANKYLARSKGLFPLRFFFPPPLLPNEIEFQAVKDKLLKLIPKEDKQHSLSDLQIANLLTLQGISCARRIVTKYRASAARSVTLTKEKELSGLFVFFEK